MTRHLKPGVHSVGGVRAEIEAEAVTAAGGATVHLAGSSMRTEVGLFVEMARGLSFPDYFGNNWDALWDCLTDLSWLPAPAYLLVISDAEQVLAEAPTERGELWRDLLTRTVQSWAEPIELGQWWDRGPIPFTILLVEGETPTPATP